MDCVTATHDAPRLHFNTGVLERSQRHHMVNICPFVEASESALPLNDKGFYEG